MYAVENYSELSFIFELEFGTSHECVRCEDGAQSWTETLSVASQLYNFSGPGIAQAKTRLTVTATGNGSTPVQLSAIGACYADSPLSKREQVPSLTATVNVSDQ